MKYLLGLLLLPITLVSGIEQIHCPHCDKDINFIVVPDFSKLEENGHDVIKRPPNWMCANCGYENYDGIRYCPICGRDRYRN